MAERTRPGLNSDKTSTQRRFGACPLKEIPCILAKNLYHPPISINASGENRRLQPACSDCSASFTVH
jgi:hypothetical protein